MNATALQSEPPVMHDDPFAVQTLLDPYPFFAALRDAGPVVRLERYGIYATGRHAETAAVLSQWQQFTNAGGAGRLMAMGDPFMRSGAPG